MKQNKTNLSVFDFVDYRRYLAAYVEDRKQSRPRFSMRSFSRVCGFRSPNYVSLIVSYRRNLTTKNIATISRACQMNPQEARYFRALVEWNQCDVEEKPTYFDELYRIQASQNQKVISGSQSIILGRWYYHVIREMVLLPDFEDDPKWMSTALAHRVAPNECEHALKVLVKVGLLKKRNNKYEQTDAVITTSNDEQNALIQQFHSEMIPQAVAALRLNNVEDRDFRGMTMAISKDTANKIKTEIKKLEERVIQLALQEEHPEFIYQLNSQLFHLTQPLGDNKNET